MKLFLSNPKKLLRSYCSTTKFASYCSYCGTKYTSLYWPRSCNCCSNTIFRNPIPVAVGLLPFVMTDNTHGLLLVKRSIKPHVGEFCLPGGFVDWAESWQEAISREIFEETSVKTDPKEFILADVHSTPDATRILIFVTTKKIRTMSEIENFKPGNETSAVIIGSDKNNLCFSLHQKVYNDWFQKNILE